MIIVITIIFSLLGMAVSYMLKNKFQEFSSIPMSNGMTGKDVAEKMLRDNGIFDVKVISVEGELTDHYNLENNTVNLSQPVYFQASVAAAAVAAHECGHAVQHAVGYNAVKMRSALVPVVNVCANLMNYANMFLFMGAGYMFTRGGNSGFASLILMVIIAANLGLTLFSMITLPVEFDASRRGLAWLESANITRGEEHDKAKNALTWAAMTYVVAALGSLANLAYYVSIFLGNRRERD